MIETEEAIEIQLGDCMESRQKASALNRMVFEQLQLSTRAPDVGYRSKPYWSKAEMN
jgi:hypothetical protein